MVALTQVKEFAVGKLSVTTAFRSLCFSFVGNLQLCDFHPKLLWAFGQMLPGKCARPLRRELVEQRNGIVIVQQNEVVAGQKFKPGSNNEAMFDGTRNGSDVHNFVGANEVFRL